MDRISNEFLEYKIALLQKSGCEAISINSDVLLPMLQELKERRAADSKKLDVKAQLRLVLDKCPDVWESILAEKCPDNFGFNNISAEDCSGCSLQCKECFDKALEGDE